MRRKWLGFTLIELLVVLAILSVIGMAAFSMLRSSIHLQSSMEERSQQLEHLTRAMNWLQSDIEQYVDRPVRDELGESEASLVLNNGVLKLTHMGWANPLGEVRSELQRVEYRITDEKLERRFWRVLDRDQDSAPIKQLFFDITGISVELLSTSGWQSKWPIEQTYLPGETAADEVPIALRMTISTRYFGSITRLFELPGVQASQLAGAGGQF